MKLFKSKSSRNAARAALGVARSKTKRYPKRHSELKHPGARFIHGGPERLKHPRWTPEQDS